MPGAWWGPCSSAARLRVDTWRLVLRRGVPWRRGASSRSLGGLPASGVPFPLGWCRPVPRVLGVGVFRLGPGPLRRVPPPPPLPLACLGLGGWRLGSSGGGWPAGGGLPPPPCGAWVARPSVGAGLSGLGSLLGAGCRTVAWCLTGSPPVVRFFCRGGCCSLATVALETVFGLPSLLHLGPPVIRR